MLYYNHFFNDDFVNVTFALELKVAKINEIETSSVCPPKSLQRIEYLNGENVSLGPKRVPPKSRRTKILVYSIPTNKKKITWKFVNFRFLGK